MREVSAGGVIIDGQSVLLLRKFRGDWVLPKGHLLADESKEEAALREVEEESGIQAEIVRYVGFVKYNFTDQDGKPIQKTVHYYHMKPKAGKLKPLRAEGFAEAVYKPWQEAKRLLTHDSERNMMLNAFEMKWKKEH